MTVRAERDLKPLRVSPVPGVFKMDEIENDDASELALLESMLVTAKGELRGWQERTSVLALSAACTGFRGRLPPIVGSFNTGPRTLSATELVFIGGWRFALWMSVRTTFSAARDGSDWAEIPIDAISTVCGVERYRLPDPVGRVFGSLGSCVEGALVGSVQASQDGERRVIQRTPASGA
jgi:hypothetical protein